MSDANSFVFHLLELRSRLLKIVIGLVVSILIFLPFSNELYTWLAQPLLKQMPAGAHMIATAVTTPFLVPMKVATLVGIFPLVIATGAGAGSRQSLGTAVFGGMFVATLLSLFVVPVLYIVFENLSDRFFSKKSKKRDKTQPKSEKSEAKIPN